MDRSTRSELNRRRHAGTVAVEFTLIGVAFFGLLLFTVQLGFRLYAQIVIDYATIQAARLLEVDSDQSLTPSRGTFQSQSFCPLLSALLSCTNVLITLRPIASDYITDINANPVVLSGALTAGAFSPGTSGSLMILQVIYIGPALSWPFSSVIPLATYNGATGSALQSSAPYANDY